MAVGSSIITADGINALANASASGTSVKPKYFKFSNQDLVLDPNLSAEDIVGWRTQDISLYQTIDSKTVEFVCDVEPTEATDYTRVCGLFLEDGTLFMVAKPPYPFPPSLRQTFKIQMMYDNATDLLEFKYIPTQAPNTVNRNGLVVDGNEKVMFERTLPSYKKLVNNGEKLFEILRESGNVVQGFAYDKFTGDGYASQVVDDKLVISKYTNISTNLNRHTPAYSVELDIEAHQALGLFYHEGEQWLTMNFGSSGQIVLFRVDSGGLLEQKIVQVYGESSGYCTVGVSECMNYLCIEGFENGVNFVKTYSVDSVMNNENIVDLYITKFALPELSSPPYPLQDMAMDRENIYVAYGDPDKAYDNFIDIYSLDGLKKERVVLTVGMDDTDKYEQEGLFWLYDNGKAILATMVATGEDGNNTMTAYSLDGESIYREKSVSMDVVNPDDSYLLDGTKVFNDDTVSLDRYYVRFFRDGKTCDCVVYLELGDFSEDVETDNATDIRFDIVRVARELGVFENITGGAFGVASMEAKSEANSCDSAINSAWLSILNKDSGNYIAVGSGEYISKSCSGTDLMKIRTQFTMVVE